MQLPTYAVVVCLGGGILLILLGFNLLSISRERIWIRIQKRNAMMGVASPPVLAEAAIRQYRIAGAMALVMGIGLVLFVIAFPLLMRLWNESFLQFLRTRR